MELRGCVIEEVLEGGIGEEKLRGWHHQGGTRWAPMRMSIRAALL
jgi:hypothetical protein